MQPILRSSVCRSKQMEPTLSKLALCHISRALQGVDGRIIHTLHDEIIVEARDGIEDQVKSIVKESMEEAFRMIIPEVPFIVEPNRRFVEIISHWGKPISRRR